MPSKVIAVANQKGGVGKTTTAVNVSACLALIGKNVLLLDIDPQANATSGVGLEKIEGASAYGPLLGEGTLAEKIQKTAFDRLSIIPSEVDLCGAELELARDSALTGLPVARDRRAPLPLLQLLAGQLALILFYRTEHAIGFFLAHRAPLVILAALVSLPRGLVLIG